MDDQVKETITVKAVLGFSGLQPTRKQKKLLKKYVKEGKLNAHNFFGSWLLIEDKVPMGKVLSLTFTKNTNVMYLELNREEWQERRRFWSDFILRHDNETDRMVVSYI